jgi:hydroxyethylthiazole kinase
VSVIRGNRAEVGALAGTAGKLRGVDAVTGPAHIEKAAQDLSRKSGAVIAATGELDLVVEEERTAVVRNGHPWMGQVTGTGCMLTAMIAAFAAVEKDLMAATLAAVASFGVAGEDAGRLANGPGSFKAALLDALLQIESRRPAGRIRLGG